MYTLYGKWSMVQLSGLNGVNVCLEEGFTQRFRDVDLSCTT